MLTPDELHVVVVMTKDQLLESVDARLNNERAFLLKVLSIAGVVSTLVVGVAVWLGWDSLSSLKEQMRSEISSTTQAYLKSNSSIPAVQTVLDDYHVRALVAFHASSRESDAEDPAAIPELTTADAAKLIEVVCSEDSPESLVRGAVRAMVSASTNPWWFRFEQKLLGLVLPRDGRSNSSSAQTTCATLPSDVRADIIRTLAESANTSSFERLKFILEDRSQPDALKAAVIEYASHVDKELIRRDQIKPFVQSADLEVSTASAMYLARWHADEPALIEAIKRMIDATDEPVHERALPMLIEVLFAEDAESKSEENLKVLRQQIITALALARFKFSVCPPGDPSDEASYRITRTSLVGRQRCVATSTVAPASTFEDAFNAVLQQVTQDAKPPAAIVDLVRALSVSSSRAVIEIGDAATGMFYRDGKVVLVPDSQGKQLRVTLVRPKPGKRRATTGFSTDDVALTAYGADGALDPGFTQLPIDRIRGAVKARIVAPNPTP